MSHIAIPFAQEDHIVILRYPFMIVVIRFDQSLSLSDAVEDCREYLMHLLNNRRRTLRPYLREADMYITLANVVEGDVLGILTDIASDSHRFDLVGNTLFYHRY